LLPNRSALGQTDNETGAFLSASGGKPLCHASVFYLLLLFISFYLLLLFISNIRFFSPRLIPVCFPIAPFSGKQITRPAHFYPPLAESRSATLPLKLFKVFQDNSISKPKSKLSFAVILSEAKDLE